MAEGFNLVLQTAVDYGHHRGVGMGLVQQLRCASTGKVRNDRIPSQRHKYNYSRQQLVTHNIKTATRAHMLAIIHALNLVRRTADDYRLKVKTKAKLDLPRKITIFSDWPKAVRIINHHINKTDDLQNMTSTNDRILIRDLVRRIQKLSRRGLIIAIVVSGEPDDAANTARTMAKQGGRKAWRDRHRSRQATAALETPEVAQYTTLPIRQAHTNNRDPQVGES